MQSNAGARHMSASDAIVADTPELPSRYMTGSVSLLLRNCGKGGMVGIPFKVFSPASWAKAIQRLQGARKLWGAGDRWRRLTMS